MTGSERLIKVSLWAICTNFSVFSHFLLLLVILVDWWAVFSTQSTNSVCPGIVHTTASVPELTEESGWHFPSILLHFTHLELPTQSTPDLPSTAAEGPLTLGTSETLQSFLWSFRVCYFYPTVPISPLVLHISSPRALFFLTTAVRFLPQRSHGITYEACMRCDLAARL